MDCCSSSPELIPLPDALEQLGKQLKPSLKTQLIPIDQSLNQTLSKAIEAPINVPGYANSAMDGYAYAHDSIDWEKAIPIEATLLAGTTKQTNISPGCCAKIMTGAPLPLGVDTVIMQENTEREGNTIWIRQAPNPGANIRPAGNDIKQGAVVAEPGERISPCHIGLFASLGMTHVDTYQPLVVGIFSNGDELKQGGVSLEFGQIYDSNRTALKAMLTKLPVVIKDYGVVKDDLNALRNVVVQADQECDLVLTSGGASVGEADYTKTVIEELGTIEFWKLAIKPGKPTTFGQLPNSIFFGLPGNPVAAAVTFQQLVVPALRILGGAKPQAPQRFNATCQSSLKKRPGRLDFQRGVATIDETGQWQVASVGAQGSDVFSSMTKANCFIVLERERGMVTAGETVTIEPFSSPLI